MNACMAPAQRDVNSYQLSPVFSVLLVAHSQCNTARQLLLYLFGHCFRTRSRTCPSCQLRAVKLQNMVELCISLKLCPGLTAQINPVTIIVDAGDNVQAVVRDMESAVESSTGVAQFSSHAQYSLLLKDKAEMKFIAARVVASSAIASASAGRPKGPLCDSQVFEDEDEDDLDPKQRFQVSLDFTSCSFTSVWADMQKQKEQQREQAQAPKGRVPKRKSSTDPAGLLPEPHAKAQAPDDRKRRMLMLPMHKLCRECVPRDPEAFERLYENTAGARAAAASAGEAAGRQAMPNASADERNDAKKLARYHAMAEAARTAPGERVPNPFMEVTEATGPRRMLVALTKTVMAVRYKQENGLPDSLEECMKAIEEGWKK